MKFLVILLILFFAGCGLLGPSEPTKVTARVVSDISVDSVFNEVVFGASSVPADTIFYRIMWVDQDWLLRFGKEIPSTYNNKFSFETSVKYPKIMQLQLDLVVWGPRSDTARATFMN